MKFKTVAEAFNHYKGQSVQQIETRAAAIGQEVNSPDADIASLNIELDGLKEARANIEQRGQLGDKLKGFNPITGMDFNNQTTIPQDDEIFSAKEYRSAFLKTMLGQNLSEAETAVYKAASALTEKRADAFNTQSSSAAVIPTQTLNEIISKARTMGGLISAARNFAIPANLSIPIATPSTKALWHVEGVVVETEKVTPTNVTFAAYELLKIFSISASAKRMSIDAFESYLTTELSNCVMDAIADALVNGTGEAQGTGILPGITWAAGNSFTFAKAGSPSYADFVKLTGMLKRGYSNGASYAMSNSTLYNLVYGLIDGNNRPIFIQDAQTDNVARILGRPVIVDDYIADDAILFGNFAYMGYNMPDGILVEVSRESSFRSGLIDYRAMAIADCKPLIAEPFVKLSRALA